MNNIIPDIVGVVGVLLILSAYFLLQIGKMKVDFFSYSFLNFIGSIMILFSLGFNWNLAAVLIEGSWALISAYGIYKYFWSRKSQGNS